MGLINKKDELTIQSERWIAEGKKFKNQLNAFLDAIYSGGDGPEEPTETRDDMALYVFKKAIEFNQKGEHQKLRALFPPAFEPFQDFYEGFARSINQLMVLKDGKIVVRADGDIYLDGGNVYLLEDDKITEQVGVLAIGISANKEYIAKVTKTEIQIYRDWSGIPTTSFPYPKDYGKAITNVPIADFVEEGLIVLSVDVFNDGKRALLATANGIFLLEENKSQCIFPLQEMLPEIVEEYYEKYEEDVPFEVEMDYFHAQLSPDNTKIAAGFQMSNHFLFEDKGKGFEVVGNIQSRSEYPHSVCFHDQLDHIALSSCHFQQSGTIGLDLSHLPIEANASWYQDFDDRFDFMDDQNWIFASVPFGNGYLLGANNGYIWYIDPKDKTAKKYLHVGSTIMSMDFSKDKKFLVVGTHSGYVIKLDVTVPERDETLITNMNIKETNRWVIWEEIDPMIW